MALGATAAQVLRLVMREGVVLLTLGAAAGVALALLMARLLGGYLNAFAGATRVNFINPMVFGCGLTPWPS